MVAAEHMIQGFGHAEDASYHNVFHDNDFGFCYLVEVADSKEPEPVEAADTEVGTQVADIGQRQCTDKGSTTHEPYVLELEGRHLLSQHLPQPPSSQQNPEIS